jgi:hypothetical protein
MIDENKLKNFLSEFADRDFQLPERSTPYSNHGVDGYQFGFADGITELAQTVLTLLDERFFDS